MRAALLALFLLGVGCRESLEAPPGTLVVVKDLQASWIRNFNPFATGGRARWPTNCGIYEPLLIFSSTSGEVVPWLAEEWGWGDHGLSLEFRSRDGVHWSDGQPFSAEDVAYTFELLETFPALDPAGLS